MPAPLVQLLRPQLEVFWKCDEYRMLLALWRRQFGKTTTLASIALRRMMERRHHLVTYASASLNVGQELILREASLLMQSFERWRTLVAEKGLKFESNGDSLPIDDFADLFQHSKLEARIYHDRTTFSRTKIIAPNAATARGFTGDVMIDEIGFIRDLRELWEAMEPIASRDPSFRVLMATTIPEDDAHFSWELSIPPEGSVFEPSDRGHWYVSQAGVRVHRVDVYDAALAGVKLYDLDSGAELEPAEHRRRAINRDAWDRNYALIFKRGGTSAISLATLHNAMQLDHECLFAEDALPEGWQANLGKGPKAIGIDLATTTARRSNPSSITIMEQVGMTYVPRVICAFKSDDPDRSLAIFREAATIPEGRIRRMCIDATNERFFAIRVKKELASLCRVELVISSESTSYMGEEMSMKEYLGNQLINVADDGNLALPESRYIREDWRLVKKNKGRFETEVDTQGRHGDTFDSTKLALHGLRGRGGPAEITPTQVGTFGLSKVTAWPRAVLNRITLNA